MKPEPMTDDAIQELFKNIYNKGFTGRNLEEAFAREVEAEVNARWEAMLAAQKPELADTRKALERVDQLEALVRKISNEADALVKGFSDEADDRITPLLEALERISRLHPANCVSVKAMLAAPVQQEPKCSDHPDAPHGFSRDASHTAGRYVCDCEGWVPPMQQQERAYFEEQPDGSVIPVDPSEMGPVQQDHEALLRQALDDLGTIAFRLRPEHYQSLPLLRDQLMTRAHGTIAAIKEALNVKS